MRAARIYISLLGLATCVCAGVVHTPSSQHGAGCEQIFYGRFISTPSLDVLQIQTGAVLVSSNDGSATITKTIWDVKSPEDARTQLEVGSDVPIIYASDDGFFFPGFIGKSPRIPATLC